MGKVLKFPSQKTRKVPRQRRPQPGWYRDREGWRMWRYYKVDDLAGARPWRHPKKVPRGPRGGIQVRKGQVWVEIHTAILWVVAELIPQENGRYRVRLMPYRCNDYRYGHEYAQVTFRSIMMAWDDYIEFHARTFRKWRSETKKRGLSVGAMAKFFGIDEHTGIRVEP